MVRTSPRVRWFGRVWLLVLVLGAAVSFLASGRLTPRLVLDGAVSFAFVPAFEVLALAVVGRRTDRGPKQFRERLDQFLAGNAPWLAWLIAMMAMDVVVPPRRIGAWWLPIAATATVPTVWAFAIDVRFFRDVLGRQAGSAVRGVVLERALAWTGAILYFLGIALWSDTLPGLWHWITG